MRSSRQAGTTLMELLVYMGLASIGLSVAYTLWGSERLTSRRHMEEFERSATASKVLFDLGQDLRRAERVVPRDDGAGVLVFFPDGRVAAWFDRETEPGVLYRKEGRPGGEFPRAEPFARKIDDLVVTAEGLSIIPFG